MTTFTVLIVDDNPQNLQVLAKILQENKYDIEFATNGEAALKWLKDKKFALVLLDINMPGMNGFEVCKRIRSEPGIDKIPVIFLTADTDRESILKGFDYGAQDYVTKPFDNRELLARVRTHIVLQDSLKKLEYLNRSLEEKVAERTQQLNEANLELNEANINLESLNNKLLELDKAKTDFLNLISHEIRTPLNGILGPVELLKESFSTGDFDELIGILDTSVKRLERFSLNALLITRLKTKQFEIKRDIIHLNDLITELLPEKKEKLQSKRIKVQLNDEIIGGIILGEQDLIKKCINNILDNAVYFSPQEGKVEIRIYFEDQYVVCEINDTGKGFATDILVHQFELFTTSDENRDNNIGIGLPIAKMIMVAHGGRIIIGNNLKGGAYVKLVFQKVN